jgi:hypothetical protein
VIDATDELPFGEGKKLLRSAKGRISVYPAVGFQTFQQRRQTAIAARCRSHSVPVLPGSGSVC